MRIVLENERHITRTSVGACGGIVELRSDGTADCESCHMPMFPLSMSDQEVTLECANRHRATAPTPDDPKMRRFVANWVARKGAQVEEQRRRWEAEEDAE